MSKRQGPNQYAGIRSKKALAWMFFDWATMPFFVLIMIFVFGPYFTQHVAQDPVTGQAIWGWTLGTASIVVAILAPFVGAIADASGRRKPMLLFFSALLVMGAALLFFARAGQASSIPLTLAAFIVALVGVRLATVLNNSQISQVAQGRGVGRVSGLGMALGSFGGLIIIGFALLFLIIDPQTGLTLAGYNPILGSEPDAHLGERMTGPIAAIWYLVFALPLFLIFKDPKPTPQMGVAKAMKLGLQRLREMLASLSERKSFSALLISVMFYRDGISAMYAFGGIYAAGVLGLSAIDVGIFGILAVAFGSMGGLVAAYLSHMFTAKSLVRTCCLVLLLACVTIASTTQNSFLFVFQIEQSWVPSMIFYMLGAVGGASSNIVQAASRTLIVEQVEPSEITRAFGLYAVASRATSFVGPLSIGWATHIWGNQQIGILPVIILIGIGVIGLSWVKPKGATH